SSSQLSILKAKMTQPSSLKAALQRIDSETKQPNNVTFIVKRNQDWFLFEIVTPSKIPGDRMQEREVQAINSQYYFRAKNTGTGWVLDRLDHNKANAAQGLQTAARNLGLNISELALTVGGHVFPEIYDESRLKLKNADMLIEGNEKFCNI